MSGPLLWCTCVHPPLHLHQPGSSPLQYFHKPPLVSQEVHIQGVQACHRKKYKHNIIISFITMFNNMLKICSPPLCKAICLVGTMTVRNLNTFDIRNPPVVCFGNLEENVGRLLRCDKRFYLFLSPDKFRAVLFKAF